MSYTIVTVYLRILVNLQMCAWVRRESLGGARAGHGRKWRRQYGRSAAEKDRPTSGPVRRPRFRNGDGHHHERESDVFYLYHRWLRWTRCKFVLAVIGENIYVERDKNKPINPFSRCRAPSFPRPCRAKWKILMFFHFFFLIIIQNVVAVFIGRY